MPLLPPLVETAMSLVTHPALPSCPPSLTFQTLAPPHPPASSTLFPAPVSIGELSKDIVSSMFALKCTSSGSPPSLLSWTRNNHTLDMAAGLSLSQWQVITDRSTASYTSWLVIDSSPSLLHGTYQCSVSNDLGSSAQDIQITGTLPLR